VAGNGAVEALTKALALELGPRLRVNCFSPGYFDTERYDHLPTERKALMLEATADSLPLRKVGTPEEAGQALLFLATNTFTTGVILDVDGGHQVRQYSYPNDVYLKLKREREET
jgi:NAD(P)-dependent dehydrogenase (short-subunit alcohol dehydrogenase family)